MVVSYQKVRFQDPEGWRGFNLETILTCVGQLTLKVSKREEKGKN